MLSTMMALVIALAPTTPTQPPQPHANPQIEHLCEQGWFVSHHGTGLCLYYNS